MIRVARILPRRNIRTASVRAAHATAEDHAHCAALLRQKDYDYWLTGLMMPAPARQAFYAVRSFNVETATILDSVRGNLMPGKLRMQWWRDAVHACFMEPHNLPQGYPVLACLADTVATHGLTRRWLDRSLDARERDLEVGQPESMEVRHGCARLALFLQCFCFEFVRCIPWA